MKPFAILLCGCLFACTVENPDRPLPELDRTYFDRAVQPVFARRCAFSDCHGTPRRFFSIYARGRYRLPNALDVDGEPIGIMGDITRRELDLNYERALGFVDPNEPGKSQIVLKPLAEEAGGLYHRASELYAYDLDVFLDPSDEDYAVLVRWVFGGAPCEDGGGRCEVPERDVPTE